LKLATLLYIKNSNGDYLLLERSNEPNKGLLSPPGGKLHLNNAESPYACAIREAKEECNIDSVPSDWKLLGIITEKNYPKIGNIMLFLFEYNTVIDEKPDDFNEGNYIFIPAEQILNSNIPESDKLFIWNFVLKNNKRFFSIHLDCDESPYKYTIESE
jgi:8-oxo-dGTP diphosphatase